ncbi:MAG TPA: hypothetical protein VIF57_29945 [Polyangia bacterium]|jgi:hypothetical protein
MRRRFAAAALAAGACALGGAPQARAAEDQVMMTPPPGGAPPLSTSTGPAPAEAPAAAPGNETPAAPPSPRPPAGWVPGTGFVIQSPDAAYRLRIGLVAAYKFEPVYQNGDFTDRNTFFVLRPSISGNFFKEWIHFWTSMELAANPPFLLDSYVELMPWKELGFRIGQQWTPYDRHEYFGPQEILFPEWAPVSEYFWTGRDKGVTVLGSLADSKLDYYAGVYSGTPLRQFVALPGNYVVQGRVTWNPLGPVGATEFPYIVSDGPAPFRISFTFQGSYGKIQSAAENFNPSTFSFQAAPTGDTRKQGMGGGDVWLQGRWFAFYADASVRRTTPPMGASYTSVGVWSQLGVPLVEKTMDIAARFNWLNPSTDVGNENFYSVEGQLAYYAMHTQNLVVKARYGLGHQSSPGMAALGPVPLILTTPGRIQLFTIQLNLAF